MCGKLGNDEIESIQNMMSMAVYAVLADVFNMDISDVSPNCDLENDLGMTASSRAKLNTAIMEMFDNLHIDFSKVKTVQDIVDQVVEIKMTNTTNGRGG